jgi:hypothetical protein
VLKNASLLTKVEAALAALSAVLGVVTLFWRDWIEVTGWDPDNHSGSAEWFIAGALILAAICLAALARVGAQRTAPSAHHSPA